jgi:predicted Zn-dependent protease
VIVDGTWGFASSSAVTKDEVAAIARQAVGIAKANRSVNTDPVTLAPVEAYSDVEWNTPVKKDPFEMPLQPKIDLLLQINEEALKVKDASFVSAFMLFVNEKKFFASTDGSSITQSLVRSYPTFSITAVNRDTNQFYQRNALTAPMAVGYEYIESLPLVEEALSGLARGAQPGALHLNPADLPLVEERMGDMLAHAGWKPFADETIERGGCRVKFDGGEVNATMKSRWDRIVGQLDRDDAWLV